MARHRRVALAPPRCRDLADQAAEIGRLGLLLALAAREGEVGVDHALHVGDVGFEAGDGGLAVAEHREFQLHARQRRAQIVADAGQHLGALGDERRMRSRMTMKAAAA